MIQDNTLQAVVSGRAQARNAAIEGPFDPWEDFLPPDRLDVQSIVDLLPAMPDQARGRGVLQQAADFVAATKRAMDMRQMTPLDYYAATRRSNAGQDRAEQSRADRFAGGQI